MINKLGITINKDEAHVLLVSSDLNGDGRLDLEEFHELIYSTNDALNIDLGSIHVKADDKSAK
jgi:hypothetical protein